MKVNQLLVVSDEGTTKVMSRRDLVASICGSLGKWDRESKGQERWIRAEEITDSLLGEGRAYWDPE